MVWGEVIVVWIGQRYLDYINSVSSVWQGGHPNYTVVCLAFFISVFHLCLMLGRMKIPFWVGSEISSEGSYQTEN